MLPMLYSMDHTQHGRTLTEAGGRAERRRKVLDFGCTIPSSTCTQSPHLQVVGGWTLSSESCKSPQVIQTAGKGGRWVSELVSAELTLPKPSHTLAPTQSARAPDPDV